jgi:hypothetical protein
MVRPTAWMGVMKMQTSVQQAGLSSFTLFIQKKDVPCTMYYRTTDTELNTCI